VCQSGFANGAKLTGPGETFSMSFDPSGFASDGQQNTLHVNAAIYSDGSHFGENALLAKLASEMFGTALETKRTSRLLSNCPDDGVPGLDSIIPQIGASAPSSSAEAAKTLKEESLPGISALVINSYLSSPTQSLREGVLEVRENAMREINEKKAIAASPLTGSRSKQHIVLEARLHGRSDMAQKYQALSQLQISYLISFIGGQNAH